jgi:hypothetical protein
MQSYEPQRTEQMPKHTLLAVAVTPYGVVHITQPDARYAECALPDLAMPIARPQRQVVAHWHCTADGRLEARWLPTTPSAA